MTPDERLVMETTIVLHGFQLYERFMNDGVWRPLLIGRFAEYKGDGALYQMVETYKTDAIAKRRALTPMRSAFQLLPWCKLHDWQLIAFHDTVVTTC